MIWTPDRDLASARDPDELRPLRAPMAAWRQLREPNGGKRRNEMLGAKSIKCENSKRKHLS